MDKDRMPTVASCNCGEVPTPETIYPGVWAIFCKECYDGISPLIWSMYKNQAIEIWNEEVEVEEE